MPNATLKPGESGFLNYQWEGHDEALLLYILGLGSPGVKPIPQSL